MTLSELSQAVIDLLARTDYTESKSHEHINRAIRRIQNAVQLPDMESTVVLTLDSNLSAGIPNDYRGTMQLLTLWISVLLSLKKGSSRNLRS